MYTQNSLHAAFRGQRPHETDWRIYEISLHVPLTKKLYWGPWPRTPGTGAGLTSLARVPAVITNSDSTEDHLEEKHLHHGSPRDITQLTIFPYNPGKKSDQNNHTSEIGPDTSNGRTRCHLSGTLSSPTNRVS